MIHGITPVTPAASVVLRECRVVFGEDQWLDVLPGTAVWNILGILAPSNRVWRDWVRCGALRINGERVNLEDTKQEFTEGLFIISKGRDRWVLDVQHA